jgi:gamma-glutamylcyclotransferase (GGCT)/AIG2-like uncharacterized protein YtfP
MTLLESEVGKRQNPIEGGIFVFAYGSNLDSKRMRDRVPSATVVGISELPLHTLRFHKWNEDGTAKANALLTGAESDRVEGVIYQVDEAHLPALDRFEGNGNGYERYSMPFRVRKGARRGAYQAWVYIGQESHIDDELLPAQWYVDHVVRGALEHGLSVDLTARLKDQAVLEGP